MSFEPNDAGSQPNNAPNADLGFGETFASDHTSTFTPIVAQDPNEDSTRPLSVVDVQMIKALPAGSALLIVSRGPNSGARFLLDSPTTIAGRHSGCDIFLDDFTVSRRHAQFDREGQGYVIRDIGSLNGTYVNRERVEEQALSAGDSVQIGKYRMTYYPGPFSTPGA